MDTSIAFDAKLPDDIIYEIYRASAQIDPPRGPRRAGIAHSSLPPGALGWIILSHVCRRWRRLGIESSTLWAQIVCFFPPSVTTILQRAKNAILTLKLRNSYNHYEYDRDYRSWTLKQAVHLLPRAQALEYHFFGESSRRINKSWSKFLAQAQTSLSVLTKLYISADIPSPLHGQPLEVPALRHLTTNVYFPIHAPSLLSLEVQGEHWHWRLLLELLQCFPLLLNFDCQTVVGDADWISEVISDEEEWTALQDTYGLIEGLGTPPTVSLSQLDILNIQSTFRSSDKAELLRHLDLPARIAWQIEKIRGTDNISGWLSRPELRYPPRDVLTFLDSCDDNGAVVQITLNGGNVPHLGLGNAPKDSVQLSMIPQYGPGEDTPSILSALGDGIASMVRILTIQHECGYEICDGGDGCDGTFVGADDFARVAASLSRFTSVTEFHMLNQGNNGPSRILPLLHTPHPQHEWLFPKLHTLVLELDNVQTGAWWNQLRAVLAARRTDGRAVELLTVRGIGACHAIELGQIYPWTGTSESEREERASAALKDCEITLAEERQLVTEVVDEREFKYCDCFTELYSY